MENSREKYIHTYVIPRNKYFMQKKMKRIKRVLYTFKIQFYEIVLVFKNQITLYVNKYYFSFTRVKILIMIKI